MQVVFISDRAAAGARWAIYHVQLPVDGKGKAKALTAEENERSISNAAFSPDGKTIAYLSADEKSTAMIEREKDAHVWGKDWAFNRLRLVDVSTGEVTVLASREAHVLQYAWNKDGSQIAFLETRDLDM